MSNSMFMGASKLRRAVFEGVVYQSIPGGSPASYTPVNIAGAGLVAGDYVMIFEQSVGEGVYGSIYSQDGGWTVDNYTWTPGYGYRASTFHKVLTGNDISTGVSYLNSGTAAGAGYPSTQSLIIAGYSNVRSAVRRSLVYDDDAGSTHTTPGYVKSADNVGTVGLIADRDAGASIAAFITSGAPVERIQQTAAFFRMSLIDALGENDYPDGATIDWTGLGTTFGEVSQLYELRG